MKTLALTPETLGAWGRTLLRAGFGLGLLILAFLTWNAPEVLPFFPALLLGGLGAWYLFRHPLLNLCVVLASFVLIVGYEEGIQPEEALYGIYYLAFLGHWYFTRLFLYRERLVETPEEKALVLFLALMTLAGVTGLFLFGNKPGAVISEWVSLSMLAFYFPVKEVCARYRKGPVLILGIILWIAFFVAVRNFINYQAILLSATQVWQVEKGRVATNDILLMIGSTFTLTLIVFTRKWRAALILLPLFALFFGGLILTQSRGYWITFALAAVILFALVKAPQKKRMLAMAFMGAVLLFTIGFLFLRETMFLVLSGLIERLGTLQSAATKDVSLINRFLESGAVWERIKQNPILGYGLGGSFHFFNITTHHTTDGTFAHNGYVYLWFKFGIFGLLTVLFFWLRSAWRGVQAFRSAVTPRLMHLGALAAAACLFALPLVANTSNPFHQNDPPFIMALMMGLAGGVYRRVKNDPASPSP